jgi:hypothetical protein
MTTAPTCIIAYTSEDDRYKHVRKAAFETALAAEARLILYDIDAAGMFNAPLPTVWSGDVDDDLFGHLLTPEELEMAGRPEMAAQVRTARSAHIDAYGWLPAKKGAGGIAEYADEQGADLIMMPAEMEDPGIFDKLRGATVEKAVEETHRPIAVVDQEGDVTYR